MEESHTSVAQIYLDYGFESDIIDYQANVPASTADNMLCGIAVPGRDAERVLVALSNKTGQNYNLDNVNVALLPGENNV